MPYDITNLYPSVPINKRLDVLMDQLNNHKDNLMKRNKFCLKDLYKRAERCLGKSYNLWNNEIKILKKSGPIGLSFMVVLSESYFQSLEHKATAEALTLNLGSESLQAICWWYSCSIKISLMNFRRFLVNMANTFNLQ